MGAGDSKYRQQIETMLVRLGSPQGNWNGLEFTLITPVRITLTACENATQRGRAYDIYRVTSNRLFGRNSKARSMYEIDTFRLRFQLN